MQNKRVKLLVGVLFCTFYFQEIGSCSSLLALPSVLSSIFPQISAPPIVFSDAPIELNLGNFTVDSESSRYFHCDGGEMGGIVISGYNTDQNDSPDFNLDSADIKGSVSEKRPDLSISEVVEFSVEASSEPSRKSHSSKGHRVHSVKHAKATPQRRTDSTANNLIFGIGALSLLAAKGAKRVCDMIPDTFSPWKKWPTYTAPRIQGSTSPISIEILGMPHPKYLRFLAVAANLAFLDDAA
ncbi:MAG: hypothetical protein LBJ77_03915 [Holosporales bacterium]|jgi:hypothetical protein|nr:hypothetical protein [Holosporales bacterium]